MSNQAFEIGEVAVFQRVETTWQQDINGMECTIMSDLAERPAHDPRNGDYVMMLLCYRVEFDSMIWLISPWNLKKKDPPAYNLDQAANTMIPWSDCIWNPHKSKMRSPLIFPANADSPSMITVASPGFFKVCKYPFEYLRKCMRSYKDS